MNKINKLLASFGVFMLLLVVTSCSDNEVEPLFDQTVNERAEALKLEYLNVLTSADNGWIGYYSPNKDFGAYTMLLDFDSNSNVSVNSDFEAGAQNKTITYRIDKTLKVELVFESTSVFSDIFAINNNNNQGEFVFNILSATQDEVVLESKLDFGDDVTVLTLQKADVSQLDLEPIYESVDDIAGDGTQSVFRNILLNDAVIGTFSFNSVTRLTTVKYLNNEGEVISVSFPIAITPTGFYLLKPLDVNGTMLTSFTYNEAENEYENTADGLRIIYDNIPGVPLNPYDLGVAANNVRYNYLEPGKSSLAFNNFYTSYTQFIFDNYGFTIDRVYIRSLNDGSVPYLHIYTGLGNIWYDLNVEITDGIVKFSLTGDTNSSAGLTAVLQPLIDVFVGAESGYYLNATGGLQTFSNGTFSMINVDDPSMEINYYDF
ncbi:DUF4302 domain-containing protein [Flavivirga sp. 57AJ16]|uniref:DUF4302 domain-containing protein n=1 Tax=Flavivirga sp. 57AJ16 TaxID=3025307 RepID=UPI0023667D01|nr:DUF4302 domain-containing protein [Flavivirga sp. 57AJ16]MDD7888206.1 DUF4302 domain-containing protein [Flavivirga sp. 57AJ16]